MRATRQVSRADEVSSMLHADILFLCITNKVWKAFSAVWRQ